MKVIDATDSIMGRLSMRVAAYALEGEHVIIVNSEKAVITGNRRTTINAYLEKRAIGSRYNGPFNPKRPDRILKRAIRGMLPYKKETGKIAMKKIKIFIGTPEAYKDATPEIIDNIKVNPLLEERKITSLQELSDNI